MTDPTPEPKPARVINDRWPLHAMSTSEQAALAWLEAHDEDGRDYTDEDPEVLA